MTYKWAPLVFARTYSVDYHLIAMPEDFEDQDSAWAMPFILGAFETSIVESQTNSLRWSVLKKDAWCVVGLTCRAYQLRNEKIRDEARRIGLQVFLGYVLHKQPLPSRVLPAMETEESLRRNDGSSTNPQYGPFSELYHFVEKHWDDNARQARKIETRGYTYDLEPGTFDYTKVKDLTLYEHDEAHEWTTLVFNANKYNNELLWTIASQQDAPLSLCLGLSRKSYAQNGPFVNASAHDCKGKIGRGEELVKQRWPTTHARSAPSSTKPLEYGRPDIREPLVKRGEVEGVHLTGPGNIIGNMVKKIIGSDKSTAEKLPVPAEGLYRANHPESRQQENLQHSTPPFGFKFKDEQATEQPVQPDTASRELSRTDRIPAGFKPKPFVSQQPELEARTPEQPSASPQPETATPEQPSASPLESEMETPGYQSEVTSLSEPETAASEQPSQPASPAEDEDSNKA